jgi:hypothetical protein
VCLLYLAKKGERKIPLCDSCDRAKFHKHPRRSRKSCRNKNKTDFVKQSDWSRAADSFDEDSDEYDDITIFHGFNRADVQVRRPRDIS